MEWRDEAVVLSARPHGESGAIVQLLTRERGRHAGFVRGAFGRTGRAVWQPGQASGRRKHSRTRIGAAGTGAAG